MKNHFEQAYPVLDKIEKAGFQAYFVGGCVRDYLLNKTIADVDIATSAYPQEIKSIFQTTFDVGIEHGTVLVLYHQVGYEITTFRTESTYQDFRRPDQVTFVRDLKDDLMRRDFTINALAMDKSGKIFDYYNGQNDLHEGIIRAVGSPTERFHEDALRMMRGVRFSAQLGFDIEPKTLRGIAENAHLLEKIAVERIAVELQKLFASTNKQKGIHYLLEANLHRYCPQMAHLSEALLKLATLPVFKDDYVNWGLLMYFGQLTIHEAKSFLKKWKLSNEIINKSIALMEVIAYRLSCDKFENTFLFLHEEDVVENAQQFLSYTCDTFVYEDTALLFSQLPLRSTKDLAVNGRDIMQLLNRHQSGAFIGEIIKTLTHKVLSLELKNTKNDLSHYILTHFSHYKG
ncbi:CCA tRNA nucleotidyltransferase [Carnobacteriaceae bacterium zg-ZUI252]|nr:CCA tRNA nucleotidyltransferase [Carnobacteriaceae bacterium zg-ZUI252]